MVYMSWNILIKGVIMNLLNISHRLAAWVVVAAGCLVSHGAQAEAFRCTVDGKIVYQQAPCEGGAKVNLSGAGEAAPDSPAAQQWRRDVAQMRRKDAVDGAVSRRAIAIGMTGDEVVRSWGRPHKINVTVTASGRSEQWIYRRGRIGLNQYVYVDDGTVTSVQTPQ